MYIPNWHCNIVDDGFSMCKCIKFNVDFLCPFSCLLCSLKCLVVCLAGEISASKNANCY